MKHHRTQAPGGRHPSQPSEKQLAAIRIAVGLLILASVVLLAMWFMPRPQIAGPSASAERSGAPAAASWTVGMLRGDGLRVLVSGREDASSVLDPQRFSQPEVRHGYWVATQIPALLNKLYCWCGCENRGVHRSNLQCFEDLMAADCQVCLGTAEIAYKMSQKGITDAATVQAAVDVVWQPK